MSSTIVSNPPRFVSQHHRPPHSSHSPPVVQSARSPPGPGRPSSALGPPALPSSSPSSSPAGGKPMHAPPQAVVGGVPVSNEYGPYRLSAEEEARRREQVLAAEGWSALSSQHHRSEYNRLKWGDKGSRLYYVPLSIQLPAHVSELMAKQELFESYCASQHRARNTDVELASTRPTPQTAGSEEPTLPSPISPTTRTEAECGVSGGRMTPPRDLEQEEGLEGTLVGGGTAGAEAETRPRPTFPTPSPPPSSHLPPAPSATDNTTTRVQEQITQAMEDQLVAPLPTPPSSQRAPSARVFSSIEAGRQVGTEAAQAQAQANVHAMANWNQTTMCQPIKTSDTHPINISILIPPSSTPALSPLLALVLPPSTPPPGFEHLLSTDPSHYASSSTKPFRLPPMLDLHHVSLTAPSVDAVPDLPEGAGKPTGKVGNFLLSSCPGKKVRLTGPVKGRGAICRDLKVDLERIRSLGVGCVVCCLDDEELNYLGAPFEEYERNAKLVGLDVLRIPMPEGLTPTSIPAFDAQIAHLIRTYTLRGIDVLSHCRGGVGRASIVAGSWAIKMGLIQPKGLAPSRAGEDAKARTEEEDFRTVESVIAVLRRRRSLKAIETYEQVRWLMEFVRWLREEGGVVGAGETERV